MRVAVEGGARRLVQEVFHQVIQAEIDVNLRADVLGSSPTWLLAELPLKLTAVTVGKRSHSTRSSFPLSTSQADARGCAHYRPRPKPSS
jgi:hypothetical protein